MVSLIDRVDGYVKDASVVYILAGNGWFKDPSYDKDSKLWGEWDL